VTRQPGISRVIAEFLLIVVGVVAALGIDRWVQRIDDARAETEYFGLLLRDVDANAEIFRSMVADWEAARDASNVLKGVLDDPSERPSDAALLMAVARAGTVNTRPVRDASFRGMESTGSLRLIRDRQLRAAIVSYFTEEIRFGRPIIEARLDLRFRTFSREHMPPELQSHRILCPTTIQVLDCELAASPSSARVWSALTTQPGMREILNVANLDAIAGANVASGWVQRTEELRTMLRRVLDG
jgi:hypothetical protein